VGRTGGTPRIHGLMGPGGLRRAESRITKHPQPVHRGGSPRAHEMTPVNTGFGGKCCLRFKSAVCCHAKQADAGGVRIQVKPQQQTTRSDWPVLPGATRPVPRKPHFRGQAAFWYVVWDASDAGPAPPGKGTWGGENYAPKVQANIAKSARIRPPVQTVTPRQTPNAELDQYVRATSRAVVHSRGAPDFRPDGSRHPVRPAFPMKENFPRRERFVPTATGLHPVRRGSEASRLQNGRRIIAPV